MKQILFNRAIEDINNGDIRAFAMFVLNKHPEIFENFYNCAVSDNPEYIKLFNLINGYVRDGEIARNIIALYVGRVAKGYGEYPGGSKLQMIKDMRTNNSSLGLKESKDICDMIYENWKVLQYTI